MQYSSTVLCCKASLPPYLQRLAAVRTTPPPARRSPRRKCAPVPLALPPPPPSARSAALGSSSSPAPPAQWAARLASRTLSWPRTAACARRCSWSTACDSSRQVQAPGAGAGGALAGAVAAGGLLGCAPHRRPPSALLGPPQRRLRPFPIAVPLPLGRTLRPHAPHAPRPTPQGLKQWYRQRHTQGSLSDSSYKVRLLSIRPPAVLGSRQQHHHRHTHTCARTPRPGLALPAVAAAASAQELGRGLCVPHGPRWLAN